MAERSTTPLVPRLEGGCDANGVGELLALESLERGWNGYEAEPPNRTAIDNARLYLAVVNGVMPVHRIEPSVMGGVGITHREDVRKVYIEFYNDGRIHALLSNRTPEMRTIPVSAGPDGIAAFVQVAKPFLDG